MTRRSVLCTRYSPLLTPIEFSRFLELIFLEHEPLLACFSFVICQKWLVSRNINLKKRLNFIDSGVQLCARDCCVAFSLDISGSGMRVKGSEIQGDGFRV